jgi:hypothetical protein
MSYNLLCSSGNKSTNTSSNLLELEEHNFGFLTSSLIVIYQLEPITLRFLGQQSSTSFSKYTWLIFDSTVCHESVFVDCNEQSLNSRLSQPIQPPTFMFLIAVIKKQFITLFIQIIMINMCGCPYM